MGDINKNKGQVALVMVLIMTVVSAVVVSVAGRATTETNVQRQSKDSSEAFLVAQTGLEDAIVNKSAVTGNIGTEKAYSVVLENKGQGGLLTERVLSGTSVDIFLANSALLQGIKVYWKSVTNNPSSISVTKITATTIEELAYDTLGLNGFTKVSTGGALSGASFDHVTPQISMNSSVTRIRITVYGESAFLGVEPLGDLLPVQAIVYRSESAVGLGEEKIKYGLSYEESKNAKTPEVFDYALFSTGTIIQ